MNSSRTLLILQEKPGEFGLTTLKTKTSQSDNRRSILISRFASVVRICPLLTSKTFKYHNPNQSICKKEPVGKISEVNEQWRRRLFYTEQPGYLCNLME